MVDVLQTYMQDAISLVRLHRAETSNHDSNHGTTDYGTKLRATEKQRLRNQYKEQEKDALDRSLYQVKETKSPTLQLPTKRLNGLACKFCAPMSSVSVQAIEASFFCSSSYSSALYFVISILLSSRSARWTRMIEKREKKKIVSIQYLLLCRLHVIFVGLII